MSRDEIRVSDAALRRMGKRAAAHVTDCATRARYSNAILVPDARQSDAVTRTLTRLYGRPQTLDRGEIAYWTIGGRDVEVA